MCPNQLFQTRFQLYCRQKHFNSFDKEHLKGESEMFFLYILAWTQIHSHQFDVVKLLKKMFEEV